MLLQMMWLPGKASCRTRRAAAGCCAASRWGASSRVCDSFALVSFLDSCKLEPSALHFAAGPLQRRCGHQHAGRSVHRCSGAAAGVPGRCVFFVLDAVIVLHIGLSAGVWKWRLCRASTCNLEPPSLAISLLGCPMCRCSALPSLRCAFPCYCRCRADVVCGGAPLALHSRPAGKPALRVRRPVSTQYHRPGPSAACALPCPLRSTDKVLDSLNTAVSAAKAQIRSTIGSFLS